MILDGRINNTHFEVTFTVNKMKSYNDDAAVIVTTNQMHLIPVKILEYIVTFEETFGRILISFVSFYL